MTGLKSRTFLGLVGVISIAALALAGCGDGEGDSVKSELRAAHNAINLMIERAEQGDVEEAEEAFDSVHGALHRIEAEVRSIDNPQALEFSGRVIEVEEEFAGGRDPSRLVELAREVLGQVEGAAQTLGLGPLSD